MAKTSFRCIDVVLGNTVSSLLVPCNSGCCKNSDKSFDIYKISPTRPHELPHSTIPEGVGCNYKAHMDEWID